MSNEDSTELKPLKLVGCVLVGGRYNAAGELVGEEPMQPPGHHLTIEEENFGRVRSITTEVAEDHVKRVENEAEARAEEQEAELAQIPDGG